MWSIASLVFYVVGGCVTLRGFLFVCCLCRLYVRCFVCIMCCLCHLFHVGCVTCVTYVVVALGVVCRCVSGWGGDEWVCLCCFVCVAYVDVVSFFV